MKLAERVERARMICAEEADHLPCDLEEIHGEGVYAAFSHRWHDFAALEKREAVMYGRTDGRKAGEPVAAYAEVFFRLQFTAENPVFVTTPESRTQDKRELADWLANEATPEQLRVFALYRGGEIDFQPEDKLLGRLLVAFVFLVDKLERLPTRDEIRGTVFPKRKTTVSATERNALHEGLKAVGLDGLPDYLPQQGERETPEGTDPSLHF